MFKISLVVSYSFGKKDPAKGTHTGTQGRIGLMEVIFEELKDYMNLRG
ncbi:MAG: hypothetical protein ACE5KJ_01620 [Candidatus Zixiibacteriota bacterium]